MLQVQILIISSEYATIQEESFKIQFDIFKTFSTVRCTFVQTSESEDQSTQYLPY